MEDLISIGTIGLIKAIESYRPNKGTKLATFAARCIENEILIFWMTGKKKLSLGGLDWIRVGKSGRSGRLPRSLESRGVMCRGLRRERS
ncbi:hypothetical protein BSK51_03115 [Paenibacillus odorifer]|uniref:RNA polymerase sigma-70 domain-containing protein n=1 Tax=Paenibacillus odorifer TaxID=189426 RepID=A0ABX3HUM3_9BACL|nr:hypothetical protein BSK51_03115 [Paenibacillus odorifer]